MKTKLKKIDEYIRAHPMCPIYITSTMAFLQVILFIIQISLKK